MTISNTEQARVQTNSKSEDNLQSDTAEIAAGSADNSDNSPTLYCDSDGSNRNSDISSAGKPPTLSNQSTSITEVNGTGSVEPATLTVSENSVNLNSADDCSKDTAISRVDAKSSSPNVNEEHQNMQHNSNLTTISIESQTSTQNAGLSPAYQVSV